MTLLLASVTGPDEAAIALAHGADIIDLKDASRGALGALDRDVLRATVAAVSGRGPVSAVTGDLPMEPDVVAAAVTRTAETKVDYVKVGLFPGPRRQDCIRALAPLAQTTKIVGVMFADRSADNDLIELMRDVDDGSPPLLDARQHCEQPFDLVLLERRGRFVQNEDTALPVQRAADRDQLAFGE